MSLADAQEFVKKIETDQSFRAKVRSAKSGSEEDKQKLATDLGLSFTAEELEQALSRKTAEGELSDEDLEAVAGGSSGTWAGVGSSAAAGTVAAAAACGW